MKEPGLLRAMYQCSAYKRMDAQQRENLQRKRLCDMVSYARENSPYYAALYRNLPPDFALAQLPPVNKRELMAHWDDWVTDRGVTLAHTKAFMQQPDNVGRRLHGKYLVFTTSGSTGEPLIALCDKATENVMGAVNAMRAYARREDMRAFLKRGGRTMGVFATDGFYLSNVSVRARLLRMPWKKRQMAIISALLPTEQIVERLNAFQPAMLGGYPSHLELLRDEAEAGRLNIAPAIVMTGGEHLYDEMRARLSEAFHCYVQTSYSCTEGGSIACECPQQHLHINDDWVIVEPVDSDYRPVADGQPADRLLLTNLFNFTQPFIRYEITDRVVLHREPCVCGNPSPWVELEGRTDDVVSFVQDGREIRVAPLPLYAVLKETHAMRQFQLEVRQGNEMELRLVPMQGISREMAFDKARQALAAFLLEQGVRCAEIRLSPEAPKRQPHSGKFKHIQGLRP